MPALNKISLACLIFCLANSAVGAKIDKQSINLGGEIEQYSVKVCKNYAYVIVNKNESYELTRINLDNFKTRPLIKFQDNLYNSFDCDDKGNYFIANPPLNSDGSREVGVDAYTVSKGKQELLWHVTFEDQNPVVDDLVVAKNAIITKVVHHVDLHNKLTQNLLALDKATGKIQWEIPLPDLIDAKITVINDTIFLTDNSGKIQAYDANDASIKWKFQGKKHNYSKPQLDPSTGTLITAYTGGSVWDTAELIGLDIVTGEVKWSIPESMSIVTMAKLDVLSGNFLYSSHTPGTKINWYQHTANTEPVLVNQWKENSSEKGGELNDLARMGDKTFAAFYSAYAHQRICLFDEHAIKLDEYIIPKHASIFFTKPVNNKLVYTTDEGEFGILGIKQ